MTVLQILPLITTNTADAEGPLKPAESENVQGTTPASSEATPNQDKAPKDNGYKFNGLVSAGVQYLSTTWRKGGIFRFQANGPELGPVIPSASFLLMSANTSGIVPTMQMNLTGRFHLIKNDAEQPAYLSIQPDAGIGYQYYMTGLDSEKTTDYQSIPFISGSASLPAIFPLNKQSKTYYCINPSIYYLRYLLNKDPVFMVDDRNGDGQPDFARPRQQIYYGLTTGINFGDQFLNTSFYFDPNDPTKKPGGKSIWAYFNFGKKF